MKYESGWWFQPLWKIWKSVGIILSNIWEKMFQTTNQECHVIIGGWRNAMEAQLTFWKKRSQEMTIISRLWGAAIFPTFFGDTKHTHTHIKKNNHHREQTTAHACSWIQPTPMEPSLSIICPCFFMFILTLWYKNVKSDISSCFLS